MANNDVMTLPRKKATIAIYNGMDFSECLDLVLYIISDWLLRNYILLNWL